MTTTEQQVRDILAAAGQPELAQEGTGRAWRVTRPGWHVFTYRGAVRIDWWSEHTLDNDYAARQCDRDGLAALRGTLEAAGVAVTAPDESVLEVAEASTYHGPMTDEQAREFLNGWYSRSVAAIPARGASARTRTEGVVKASWRRDPAVPAGQPAAGTFTCTCGTVSPPLPFGGPDWTCATCGRSWDGRGWLLTVPKEV